MSRTELSESKMGVNSLLKEGMRSSRSSGDTSEQRNFFLFGNLSKKFPGFAGLWSPLFCANARG